MGIKLLNTFLKSKCHKTDSISKMSLDELQGEKIAIDTSIYLYRYSGENALIENFYTMCSLFHQYDITPVFVFEGKPPEEKMEELYERKQAKKDAEEEYNKTEELYKKMKDQDKKQELEQKMDYLRKQFIKINKSDVEQVKILIQNFGMTYINAEGEADVTCAALELKGKVQAVLSEDMDLFAYGCKRIMRYFSLIKHSIVLYNVESILNHIGINKNVFELLCFISGNDYMKSKKNVFLYFDWIKKQISKGEVDLNNKESIINSFIQFDENINNENIQKVSNLYHINIDDEYRKISNISIMNSEIHIENLKEHMSNYGFMFC